MLSWQPAEAVGVATAEPHYLDASRQRIARYHVERHQLLRWSAKVDHAVKLSQRVAGSSIVGIAARNQRTFVRFAGTLAPSRHAGCR